VGALTYRTETSPDLFHFFVCRDYFWRVEVISDAHLAGHCRQNWQSHLPRLAVCSGVAASRRSHPDLTAWRRLYAKLRPRVDCGFVRRMRQVRDFDAGNRHDNSGDSACARRSRAGCARRRTDNA